MNLDNLNKIEQVEVPPFLFTRIQEKIKQRQVIPVRIAYALSFSFVIILFVNVYVILNHSSDSNSKNVALAKALHITTNNHLY